ncbi:TspO/MBR family protein [Rhizomicrobium electricum]|uniref:Tryptophan-rich sensory protein n=1 Tax=Rhizomicrobium electricum TaxID=480070 RepID=A0ABP3Q2I1_9PROT|nr:TspO/MBR family protein [Rhizomicrobium electricum]NIJ49304.1 tryptophan-rich sensory protein [Rhizomicrobium electricum]
MEAAFEKRPAIGLSLLVLFGFLAFTLAAGFAAGQVTAPNIPSWYNHLAKPSFNPPNWVFAPVWSALYVLIAVAAWRVWRAKGFRTPALALWLVQLGLNFAWSFIFFGAHAAGAALADLVLLWGAIFATLIAFGRIDKPAGWLLIPYLGWVSFAGVLNFWVWQLNA